MGERGRASGHVAKPRLFAHSEITQFSGFQGKDVQGLAPNQPEISRD